MAQSDTGLAIGGGSGFKRTFLATCPRDALLLSVLGVRKVRLSPLPAHVHGLSTSVTGSPRRFSPEMATDLIVRLLIRGNRPPP
jgi:hypothetical protein